MPLNPHTQLNTGAIMPTVGLGTWKSQPGAVEEAVEYALRNGYTSIDGATAYGNEFEVGKGIAASGVPRGSFFLTTKLNNNDHGKVEEALHYSLKQLNVDYIDLWLMHWPAPMVADLSGADKSINWIDTWKEMERVYKAYPNKVKAIGLSNVSINFMEKLLPQATVIPAVNQIELHPSCNQAELVEYCKNKGIVVTAYSPLGSDKSPLHENEVVVRIAKKYSVQSANILISLQANRPGVNVLTKSVTKSRILNNKNVVDLTPEEISELMAIEKTAHFRVCGSAWTGWGSLGFPDLEA